MIYTISMYLKSLPTKFAEPTFNLGYFLGVMKGDGSYGYYGGKEKSNYAINLQTITEEFADLFRDVLSKLTGFNIWKSSFYRKNTLTFNVMTQSKALYSFLLANSETGIPRICYGNDDCLKGFFSGFFDSDGCLVHDRQYIYLDFANNELKLLDDLREVLMQHGYHPSRIFERQKSKGAYPQNKPVYRFKLGRQQEVKKVGAEWLKGFKHG